MRRAALSLVSIAVAIAPALAVEDQASESAKIWLERPGAWEELLRTAEVVSVSDVGMGVTEPKEVALKSGAQAFRAVWKPIQRGRETGFWESYEAEVGAYELDQLLGLNMVPPTVVRRIGGTKGSLQLWAENCRLYRDVLGETPHSVHWNRQISLMKMFDLLISNPDRNSQNFMIDGEWNIILIDHSRAFISGKKLPRDPAKLPIQFNRRLVEKLHALDEKLLTHRLGGLLQKWQIKSVLARRDALLRYADDLIAEKGEAVLF